MLRVEIAPGLFIVDDNDVLEYIWGRVYVLDVFAIFFPRFLFCLDWGWDLAYAWGAMLWVLS